MKIDDELRDIINSQELKESNFMGILIEKEEIDEAKQLQREHNKELRENYKKVLLIFI